MCGILRGSGSSVQPGCKGCSPGMGPPGSPGMGPPGWKGTSGRLQSHLLLGAGRSDQVSQGFVRSGLERFQGWGFGSAFGNSLCYFMESRDIPSWKEPTGVMESNSGGNHPGIKPRSDHLGQPQGYWFFSLWETCPSTQNPRLYLQRSSHTSAPSLCHCEAFRVSPVP